MVRLAKNLKPNIDGMKTRFLWPPVLCRAFAFALKAVE